MTTTKSATEEITTADKPEVELTFAESLKARMSKGVEMLSSYDLLNINFDFYMIPNSLYTRGTTSRAALEEYMHKDHRGDRTETAFFVCTRNIAVTETKTETTIMIAKREGLDIHV